MRPSLFTSKRIYQCAGVLGVAAIVFVNMGAAIDHATITEVVNDVKVLDPATKKSKPAASSEIFGTPDIMKTGDESRSEMISEDQTITRVGANTLFSFEPKSREINLREGSVLFQSPHGKGGGTIRTASATASVLGTTIVVVATKDGGFKFLVLEGTGFMKMPNGIHLTLHAGQMVYVPPGGKNPGPVLDFLLSEEVRTAWLVTGFKHQLPSWHKIELAILKQQQEIANGQLQLPTTVLSNLNNINTRVNRGLNTPTPFPKPFVPTPVPTPRPTPRAATPTPPPRLGTPPP